MLTRDLYTEDFTRRFYPRTSIDTYEKDMFFPSKRLLHSIVLNEEEQKTLQSNTFKANSLTFGTLVGSILALFLYNRIPLIKRVQRRGRRILLKCMIVILPFSIASIYVNYINVKFLVTNFEKNQNAYRMYKLNGDIKALSPNVPISDY